MLLFEYSAFSEFELFLYFGDLRFGYSEVVVVLGSDFVFDEISEIFLEDREELVVENELDVVWVSHALKLIRRIFNRDLIALWIL